LLFGIYVSLVEPGQVRTNTLASSIIHTKASTHYDAHTTAERARADGYKASLSPVDIAATVLAIVESSRPRLRYPVGRQVRLVTALYRLLPARLFEHFILRQFVQPLLS
jgi:short-subunit dehydrogenase